jgi:hypothetical protein
MGRGGTGIGTAGDVSGGAGTAGCGVADSGTGSGSIRGGAGCGFFVCSVSGNCLVALSGRLDSGVFENTDMSVLGLVIGGRTVMARLLLADGLIGRTYW